MLRFASVLLVMLGPQTYTFGIVMVSCRLFVRSFGLSFFSVIDAVT